MIEAIENLQSYYGMLGYKRITYKAVPSIYHRAGSDDDLYALFRLGAVRTRCDLSAAIDLNNRLKKSDRRVRSHKKANALGVSVLAGLELASPMWDVLRENLAEKHDAKPVHSLGEILLLARRFPENLMFVAGLLNGEVVAAVVTFASENVHHAQYIAANALGREACALDAVFEHCIGHAQARGARWFDFGTSNEDAGTVLNEGLYQFKTEFGGGGVIHEFYEMSLSSREGR